MTNRIFMTIVLLAAVALAGAPRVWGADAPAFSPEEMKALDEQLDRQVDKYVEWLTQMYDLDAGQQGEVRKQLQQVKQAHVEYGPKAAAQMTDLQAELKYYMEKARSGEAVDKNMVQDLQARLQAVIEQAPMTFNNVILTTEKVLPDAQVVKGRERQRAFRERMKETQERAARQYDSRLAPDLQALQPYLADEQAVGADPLPPVGTQPPVATTERKPTVGPASQPAPQPKPAVHQPVITGPIVLDEWGKYVNDFIDRYKLDRSQQQQSHQILTQLRRRADEYRMTYKVDYDAAEKIEDKAKRIATIEALDKPIARMFDELKTRLADIPSAEQRKLAGDTKAPASQPRPAATAPATRPAPVAGTGK